MNIRIISQTLLCCLFPAMVVFGQADQIERNPVAVSVSYADGVVKMKIKNNSSNPIKLSQLNGKLVWIRLEVWGLGRGIELYSGHDAEWRREGGFVDIKGYELKAGTEVTHRIPLSEARSSDESNDELAKDIKRIITSQKTGHIAAIVAYSMESKSAVTCTARGEITIDKPLVPVPKVEQAVPPNGP